MERSRARHGSRTLDRSGYPHGKPSGFETGLNEIAIGMIARIFLEECSRERLSQHLFTAP